MWDERAQDYEIRWHLSVGRGKGVVVELTNYGAGIREVGHPTAEGYDARDVVMGFDDRHEYEGRYHASIVGRVANRINHGRFVLDGQTVQLDCNKGNGKFHLHGGYKGFSHRFWNCKPIPNGVEFMLTSNDGDQWYPGAVDVKVTYTLVENNREGSNVADLRLKMEGVLVGDKPTPINLTNHAAFNLEGHNSKDQLNYHTLQMDCDAFNPVDENLIPTFKVQYFQEDGPDYMDFRSGRKLGTQFHRQLREQGISDQDALRELYYFDQGLGPEVHEKMGIDHNYVINREPEDTSMKKFATLSHENGRFIEVSTNQPGCQIYTQNFLDRQDGKSLSTYRRRQGICFETQTFPDSLNMDENNKDHEEYAKGKCFILRPGGEPYLNETVYSFGCVLPKVPIKQWPKYSCEHLFEETSDPDESELQMTIDEDGKEGYCYFGANKDWEPEADGELE